PAAPEGPGPGLPAGEHRGAVPGLQLRLGDRPDRPEALGDAQGGGARRDQGGRYTGEGSAGATAAAAGRRLAPRGDACRGDEERGVRRPPDEGGGPAGAARGRPRGEPGDQPVPVAGAGGARGGDVRGRPEGPPALDPAALPGGRAD